VNPIIKQSLITWPPYWLGLQQSGHGRYIFVYIGTTLDGSQLLTIIDQNKPIHTY
jgi:hypothetical protein